MKFKKLLSYITSIALCMTSVICPMSASKANVEFADIVSKTDTTAVFKDNDLKYTFDDANATYINLSDNASSVNGNGAVVNGNIVTIKSQGTYVVSGTLTNGQLVVNDTEKTKITIVLSSVNIKSADGAAIYIQSADKVYLMLKEGTVNTLEDSVSRTDTEQDAALYSADDLTINGKGTLEVVGNYKNAIHSKNDLKICYAQVYANSALAAISGHALSGNDLVAIADAKIELKSGNDGIHSDNNEDTKKANVILQNSSLNITSGGDGIQTENALQITGGTANIITTSDGDGLKAGDSVYIDGEPTIEINSVADGIKTDFLYTDTDGGNIQIENGKITIKTADEGLQAMSETSESVQKNASVLIKNGTLDITSTGDGIKATKSVQIKDASIKVNSSSDAIQAENESDTSVGSIEIQGGTFEFTSVCDGIQAATALNIFGGNFTIKTTGSASSSSCKGLKATGCIVIDGGSFDITSTDDGVHSNGTIIINDCEKLNISTADDGIHADTQVTINGGNINITKSYEGVEGASIVFNGGNTFITASDDGVNASDGSGSNMGGGGMRPFAEINIYASAVSLTINGGNLTVNASGDGLDSNGTFSVTGGTTLVYGPTSGGNGILDFVGNGSVSGGTLVALGTSDMAQNFSSSVNQCSIMLKLNSSRSANTTFAVCDSQGTPILAATAKKSTACIIVTSPEIKANNAYTFKTGGTIINGENGFAMGDGCFSGGTTIVTTTPTSNIWSINESGASVGGGQGGGMMPGEGGQGGGTRPTRPSGRPTRPTNAPVNTPVATQTPTAEPTATSTVKPTVKPTPMATIEPTVMPTIELTIEPTYKPEKTPDTTQTAEITLKEESEYTLDKENELLSNIPLKTDVESVKQNIEGSVEVYNANGEKADNSDIIKTGDIIRLANESGEVIAEVTVYLEGDINGDGMVNSRDIALLQRRILGTVEFTKVMIFAADMLKDAKINSRDVAVIQREIINKQ